MKKALIALIIVLSSGDLFAVSYGFNIGLSPIIKTIDYTNKRAPIPTPLETTIASQNYFSIGLFFDFDYLRLTISGQSSIGTVNIEGLTNRVSYTNLMLTNSTIYLNLEFLLKLPVKITEGFAFWPAIGVEYGFCLFDGQNFQNTVKNAITDLRNDFYLKAGIGLDIGLGKGFSLAPVFLFGYNLTPIPCEITIPELKEELTYHTIKFDLIIGIAFNF